MATFSVLNSTGLDTNNDGIGDGIQFGSIFSTVAAAGLLGFPIITPTNGTVFFLDAGNLTFSGTGMGFTFPSTFSGTLTDLTYTKLLPVFTATGLSVPLADVAGILLGGGSELTVLATMFSGNDTIGGSTVADTLKGFDGNDVLHGGAGADNLDGGNGIDTADYQGSAAGVTIDLVLGTGIGGDAQGDLLSNIENVTGSAFDDRFTGSAGANTFDAGAGADVLYGKDGNDTLLGGAGDDKLVGGLGSDVLNGGAGSDWAYYHEATAGVVANLADSSQNTGEAAGDTYVSIENLWGTAFNDTLTGDAGANNLFGNDGNDTLNGGDGDDLLQGGNGNDALNGGAGADGLYGNEGADTLNGGDGNDRLVGGNGADVLNGGAGTDWAYYHTSSAGVTVNLATNTGSGGEAQGDTYISIENVYGSAFNDTLTGNNLTNVLLGNTGQDTLTGGGANDYFLYQSVSDSTVAAPDTITDFSHTQGDKIDLRPIDADGNSANGDTAFTFTSGGVFTGIGHEVIVQAGDGGVYMALADVNGDGVADLAITVHSTTALVAADFLL